MYLQCKIHARFDTYCNNAVLLASKVSVRISSYFMSFEALHVQSKPPCVIHNGITLSKPQVPPECSFFCCVLHTLDPTKQNNLKSTDLRPQDLQVRRRTCAGELTVVSFSRRIGSLSHQPLAWGSMPASSDRPAATSSVRRGRRVDAAEACGATGVPHRPRAAPPRAWRRTG